MQYVFKRSTWELHGNVSYFSSTIFFTSVRSIRFCAPRRGVWHGKNYCSVVAPAILTFREKFQTKKAPFQTKSSLHVNTLRWDGNVWSMSGSFGGVSARTKNFRFCRSSIWMLGEACSSDEVKKVRENLWILRSKLTSLVDLAACKTPVDVDADDLRACLGPLALQIPKLRGEIATAVACKKECASTADCKCEDGEDRRELCHSLVASDLCTTRRKKSLLSRS